MKIESGKTYLTRCGKEVTVIKQHDNFLYTFICKKTGNTYTAEGLVFADRVSEGDLVAEHLPSKYQQETSEAPTEEEEEVKEQEREELVKQLEGMSYEELSKVEALITKMRIIRRQEALLSSLKEELINAQEK